MNCRTMKIILIFLFAGFTFADLVSETQDVQGPVEDILEKIKKAIPEPITLDEFDLVIPDNIFVSGSLNISNFNASGLKNFTYKVKLFPTSLEMGLEKLSLDTGYAMELPLMKIPLLSIFGDGTLRIVVSNVNVKAEFDLGGLAAGEAIKSFDLDIKNIEFGVTGVLDDDDVSKGLSDIINKNTIELFHKYSKNISQLIRTVMNKVIDAVISKNKTLSVEEGADIAYKNGYSPSLWEALNDMFVSLL